ncbi:MAG TPA: DUF885 domain-containing protein [Candidatus Deferrimicrobiaceae bacterium]|nr:DUF885 domain-containing protein [Candidatus Deferrimicrobiaceae bacterium]
MSDRQFAGVELTRPGPAPDEGAFDEGFYDLVESRFRAVVESDPAQATYLGIHAWDDRLDDPSRERILGDIERDRRHLAAVAALDPTGLSAEARFERELELHHLRLGLYHTEVIRTWERRSSAVSDLGDALFPLFTRDFAPLSERLASIAARLEGAPEYFLAHRTRAAQPEVRPWLQVEISAAMNLPPFLDEIVAAADSPPAGVTVDDALRRRLRRAVDQARPAVFDQVDWIQTRLDDGTDEWALGDERYGELLRLRAFDDLDADAILEIGYEQLARNHEARVAAARELDPSSPVETVLERVKSDHPATFEDALEAYRTAMQRARAHLIEHGLVTVPDDERVDVVATPSYLRGVLPFAAYFQPARWDPSPVGVYVVTPAVDDHPGAMREHYLASISNTSIHEAYPGHHLQLAIAARHPSLTRAQVNAPEFEEGWGMYSEQMMREEGFDDGPAFRIALATDAIWRAARIILDIRMHRGELSIDEAAAFLVEQTGFEEPNAFAEVRRYTSTPSYNLSYLLGKVLILSLRDEERRRLGERFSLRAFHDALLWNGSLPISFQRRALRGEGRPADPPAPSTPAGSSASA